MVNKDAFKGKTFYMPMACGGVGRMIDRFGGKWTRRPDVDFDAVIWTGGEDISPFLYGERPLNSTHFNIKRDLKDVKTFKNLSASIPKIGICRGGQLLNVLNGGCMWQDVDGHTKAHTMRLFDNTMMKVSSTHHQMMIPADHGEVLAWGKEAKNKYREDERQPLPDNNWEDCEVVYYENTNTLCFQPHPEYPGYDDCTATFVELVTIMFKEKKNDGPITSGPVE